MSTRMILPFFEPCKNENIGYIFVTKCQPEWFLLFSNLVQKMSAHFFELNVNHIITNFFELTVNPNNIALFFRT